MSTAESESTAPSSRSGRWNLILLLGLSGLVITGIVLMSLIYTGTIWFNMPSLHRYPIQGLDVSAHQGKIYWNFVDTRRWSFVYIKATEGGDFKDPRFAENWRASAKTGLKRGAYHFFTFCKPGAEQAQNFMQSVPVEAQTLPPVVDLEFGGNCAHRPEKADFIKELGTFLQTLEQHYRQKPVLYLTRSFAQSYLSPDPFPEQPLWYRDILKKPGPVLGRPWQLWQYSNRGHVEGIEGFVDQNVFAGTAEAFAQFLKPQPATAPAKVQPSALH